eukprot:s33_g19.t1
MRMRASQTWDDAAREVLFSKLGIEEEWMREGMSVTLADQFQEVELSQSFPGLKTVYVITEPPNGSHLDGHGSELELFSQLLHSQPSAEIIGLPGGVDFTFARQRPVGQSGDIDTVIIRWGWTNAHDVEYQIALQGHRFLGKQPSLFDKSAGDEVMQNISNKVLAPEPLPDFYADISAAFPELRLYRVERDSGKVKLGSTSASRTSDDEYQRTIGALFCIFWMMRLHLDGKECFCFGLDADWKPCRAESFPEVREAEFRKRKAFYDNTNWFAMEELLVGAGLLNPDRVTYDADRALTMLVLMSIHDIMKLDLLRPIATEDFRGYEAGDPISDHDVALSYVLERYPKALPSFAGLSHEQQSSIKFAHCKLEYNMGWLVQAEAPPGALFSSFREVVLSGEAKGSQDGLVLIHAFYFCHWFADLAGAEASPMQGCEKFVLKFPQHVLGNFLNSFPVVWQLGPKTETEVYEDYLLWRWSQLGLSGSAPTGTGAVAQIRLAMMAQGDSAASRLVRFWQFTRGVIKPGSRVQSVSPRSFHRLSPSDQTVLSSELALTGCTSQKFRMESTMESRGPALLLYYAPALMQKAGRTAPFQAMHILAEVFRKARALWPLSSADADKTVVDLEASAIVGTEGIFVLSKNSARDGQVRTMSPEELSRLDSKLNAVLAFGRACGLNLPGDDLVRTSLRGESRPRTKTPWYHVITRDWGQAPRPEDAIAAQSPQGDSWNNQRWNDWEGQMQNKRGREMSLDGSWQAMDGREPLKRQKQEMPGLVRTEALVFEAGGDGLDKPGKKEKKEKKDKAEKKERKTRTGRDPPVRLHGNLWEVPKQNIGLQLIKDRADMYNWQYPFWDDSRRSFAGLLRSPWTPQQCSQFYTMIQNGTNWIQPVGEKGPMPRKTAWLVRKGCECSYSYGPFEVPPAEFPPWMVQLMSEVMPFCGFTSIGEWPDCCNLNLYTDGASTVGWHSDDEALFQGRYQDITIISMSLGVPRSLLYSQRTVEV